MTITLSFQHRESGKYPHWKVANPVVFAAGVSPWLENV